MGTVQSILRVNPNPFPYLSAIGWMYDASPATTEATATGATSYATTTPTFLLDVPEGITCIPAQLSLAQAGTVAGGAISVIISHNNADHYTSGGTAATIENSLAGGGAVPTNSSGVAPAFYSTIGSAIVATDVVSSRIKGWLLGQDVSPAEGAVQEIEWVPNSGLQILKGPAAFLVYTYAGSTGPTWFWSFKFAAFKTTEL
jgi:hypothetical protein